MLTLIVPLYQHMDIAAEGSSPGWDWWHDHLHCVTTLNNQTAGKAAHVVKAYQMMLAKHQSCYTNSI